MTDTDTVERRAIEAELADCCEVAKTYGHDDVRDLRWAAEHEAINRLLTRRERLAQRER